MSAKNWLWRVCLLLSTVVFSVNSQCPTLPSGQCFVDCTRLVYRIVCESANGAQLYGDLLMYINTTQMIELSIYSADLKRIGAIIFEPVATLILQLDLDNLVHLQYFPELRALTNLKQIRISNSPLLIDMPTELLPSNLERIHLKETGITKLQNDFAEVPSLPKLKHFIFTHGVVDYIQPGYFSLFPNLVRFDFHSNILHLVEPPQNFQMVTELDYFDFSRNSFLDVPRKTREKVLEVLLDSVRMAPGGHFDFSNNHLPITDVAADHIWKFSTVRTLNLHNNGMEDYVSLSNPFENFTRLQKLDLSNTKPPKAQGLFKGLPLLEELYLAKNDFRGVLSHNLFEGCQSQVLRLVDLSSTNIENILPGLSFASKSLTVLILRDNILDLASNEKSKQNDTDVGWESGFDQFPNLLRLDISQNNLQTFRGEYLSSLKQLEFLDLSCNNFAKVTKEFFKALPKSLQNLNLTFCANDDSQSPQFDRDAFSTIPPIKVLILRSGRLTSSIFQVLSLIEVNTLAELDLSDNMIPIIPSTMGVLAPLKTLKTLRLRYNLLQSLQGFENFPNLEELDLSQNELSSIGKADFNTLPKLRILSLSSNNIIDVDPGSFGNLNNLQAFYFKDNLYSDIGKMFGSGGGQIRHLGLQNLQLPCLPVSLFRQMPMLKWVYMNKSVPLFVGRGSFRNIDAEMQRDPLRPVSFRKLLAEDLPCDRIPEHYFTSQENCLRIIAADKYHQVDQKLVISFPICHATTTRDIARVVSETVCRKPPVFLDMSDSDILKTSGPKNLGLEEENTEL